MRILNNIISYQKIGYHPNVNADVHLTSDLKRSQINFMKSTSLAVIAWTFFLFNFLVRGASKALPVWTGLSNWNQKNIAPERIGITQASMQCVSSLRFVTLVTIYLI